MPEISKTVLETLDTITDIVTDKVVKPAHKLARISVYSFVVGMLVLLVLIFISVASFRATTLVVSPWIAYLIWGAIFSIIGAVLWAKK